MASEQNPANLQIQNFIKLAQAWPLNIDAYLKGPSSGLIFSLNSQIKGLSNLEKRNAPYLEEATSGESSPCISDNEQEVRFRMPSLRDVSELLTEELSLEVDEHLEKLRDMHKKGISFVFENFDQNFRSQKLFGYLKDIKVNGYSFNRILGVRESKTIVFRGTVSMLIEFSIQKHDLLIEYLRKLETYLLEETRRRIKISRVVDDRKKRGQFFAAIIRNLPPRISGRDIVNQCQREVSGQLQVGTILKIKDKYCCIMRFDNLEDAELVCRRLNNFQLKDSQTFEKYLLKAHLHPQSALKHTFKRNSIFSEYFPQKEREIPEPAEVPLEQKTSINDLKSIFMNAKKPSQPEKPKPPPEIQKKEPANVERTESREPLETDEFLRRMYSSQYLSHDEPPPPPSNNGENAFAFMMQMSVSQDIYSKENIPRGNEKRDGYDDEPRRNYYENGDKRNYREKTTPLSIVKDSSGKDRRDSQEGSPSRFSKPSSHKYGRETSSRTHHHHNQNRSHNSSRKDHSHSQIERGLQIERRKDRRRSKSRSQRSKSGDSRSRSRSRSKSEKRKHSKKRSKKDKHRDRSGSRKGSRSYSKDRKRSKRSRSRSKSNSPPPPTTKGKGRESNERNRYKELDKRSRSRSKSKSPTRKRGTENHKRSPSRSRDRSKNRNKSNHRHHSQTDKSYNKDYQDPPSNRRKQNENKKYYSDHYRRDNQDKRDDTRSNKKRDDSYYEDSRRRKRRSKSKNSRSRSRTRSESVNLKKDKKRSKERKVYKSSNNGRSPDYKQDSEAPPAEKGDVPVTSN